MKYFQNFETTDALVRVLRPILIGLEFAWVKFSQNDKYRPAFLHPVDSDGIQRAQEVTTEGYISDEKLSFVGFECDIPEQKKAAAQIKKLKILNKKFNFSLK